MHGVKESQNGCFSHLHLWAKLSVVPALEVYKQAKAEDASETAVNREAPSIPM